MSFDLATKLIVVQRIHPLFAHYPQLRFLTLGSLPRSLYQYCFSEDAQEYFFRSLIVNHHSLKPSFHPIVFNVTETHVQLVNFQVTNIFHERIHWFTSINSIVHFWRFFSFIDFLAYLDATTSQLYIKRWSLYAKSSHINRKNEITKVLAYNFKCPFEIENHVRQIGLNYSYITPFLDGMPFRKIHEKVQFFLDNSGADLDPVFRHVTDFFFY